MIATAPELLGELSARGLIPEGVAPGGAERAAGRPWYIGLMLGVAGWVAGVFLLVVVMLIFEPKSSGSAFFMGPVLLAAAWGLFKVDREGAFVSQLALALSIAGQFAVVFALGETFFKSSHSIAGIAFIALLLQVALIVVMPNGLHRTMSALFACVAWALLVRYGMWDQSETPYGQASRMAPSLGYALVGWALSWLPVGGLLWLAILKEPAWMAAGRQAIVRPATVGLVVALAVGTLLSQPFESFTWLHSGNVRQGWLAIWPLLSALAALGGLAAAFALGHRGLTATCVVAALMHASHFYYAMGASLLFKSATMIVLGALLLGAAHSLRQRGPS
jgi:hypothetical protein